MSPDQLFVLGIDLPDISIARLKAEHAAEFCSCRDDRRLSGRVERLRRKATIKPYGKVMAGLDFEEFEVSQEFITNSPGPSSTP
jgi:hypothetical protein